MQRDIFSMTGLAAESLVRGLWLVEDEGGGRLKSYQSYPLPAGPTGNQPSTPLGACDVIQLIITQPIQKQIDQILAGYQIFKIQQITSWIIFKGLWSWAGVFFWRQCCDELMVTLAYAQPTTHRSIFAIKANVENYVSMPVAPSYYWLKENALLQTCNCKTQPSSIHCWVTFDQAHRCTRFLCYLG